MKCPNCNIPMDFVARYILDVRLESAAPSHLKDFEAWRCENGEPAQRCSALVALEFVRDRFQLAVLKNLNLGIQSNIQANLSKQTVELLASNLSLQLTSLNQLSQLTEDLFSDSWILLHRGVVDFPCSSHENSLQNLLGLKLVGCALCLLLPGG